MLSDSAEIVIIGAGASGIAAAAAACRTGHYNRNSIVILEKNNRLGKKLLATGNGRCNIGNVSIQPSNYSSDSAESLERILSQLPVSRVQQFLKSLSLFCDEEDGRLYPYSRSASAAVEVLSEAINRPEIEIHLNTEVSKIEQTQDGYLVYTQEGKCIKGKRVLLSAGGAAAPKLGGTDWGCVTAVKLGHSIERLEPCLTAFVCSNKVCAQLKGMRAKACASLYANSRLLAKNIGEIQFTEYGISGIPAFQISRFYTGSDKTGYSVQLDLFPDFSFTGLAKMLQSRSDEPKSASAWLKGTIQPRLAEAALQNAGIRSDMLVKKDELTKIVQSVKEFTFSITEVKTWDFCQVMRGGVSLKEINPTTMESKKCPGLYFAGEVLDAAGDCGGYNLHWAIGTGLLAGEAMAGKTNEKHQKRFAPSPQNKKKK